MVECSLYVTSLDEKKAQIDKSRQVRSKINGIDLKPLEKRDEIKADYSKLKLRLDSAKSKIAEVIETNERAFKDHLNLKEACNEFSQWMRSVRDKIPILNTGTLSDRLQLESSLSLFEKIQKEKPVGEKKLKLVKQVAGGAAETSSSDGITLINNNVQNLEKDLKVMFEGVDKKINELNELQVELKNFREEYEQVNEWLQNKEKEIKQERSAQKGSTLEGKLDNVASCKRLVEEFEDFKRTSIKKLESKDYLLKSHLEGYIRNQLKLVDSRYQVLLNLLKDITAKVSEVAENHSLFAKKLSLASDFIRDASDKLATGGTGHG